jgi:hypothetical protein
MHHLQAQVRQRWSEQRANPSSRQPMTSERKIDTNRENARKSTGPRTNKGKARASRNALRHGLESVKFGDGGLSGKAKRIARMICKNHSDPFLHEQAVVIAESQVLVARVRAARIAAIERMRKPAVGRSAINSIADKGDDVQALCAALPELPGLERYEQRALSRRRRAIRRFDQLRD